MASLSSSSSSTVRLLSPKLPSFSLKPAAPHPVFLSPRRPLPLLLFSPISFHRLSPPPPCSHLPPAADVDVDPSVLPPKLLEIVSLFQSVPDPKAKYQQLLHYASRLPPMPAEHKTETNQVRGCVSRVWVRAYGGHDGAVHFEADSDAVITRGLAALLVMGLSGEPPDVVARVPPGFVRLLGLRQSLTPSRNNGFLNMLQLMQRKALELCSEGSDSAPSEVSDQKDSILGEKINVFEENLTTGGALEQKDYILGEKIIVFEENSTGEASQQKDSILGGKIDESVEDLHKDSILGDEESVIDEVSGVNGSQVLDWDGSRNSAELESKGDGESEVGLSLGGRAERIREKLEKELAPVELEVEDISYRHAGHAAVRGSGDGETHFNLRVVSKEFEGKSLVKRHRLVYNLLQDELQSGLHALSIDAKTPDEIQSS